MTAVQLQTTIVSTNTPSIWIKPWLTGCFASEVAAEFGAEPIPASLENKPRLIPISIVLETKLPNIPPATAEKSKALSIIRPNIAGTRLMFIPKIITAMIK